jgi:CRP-like cAMP-binding protein
MRDPLNQRQTYLRNLPLFGGVNLDACRLLAQAAETISLEDGATLYCAGETADAVFILYAGRVRLEQDEVLLAELGEGDHMGDMEFFDMAVRGCTARAHGDCEVWQIPFVAFDHLRRNDLKAFALITMNAARHLSRRLREVDLERCQLHRQLEQSS